VMACRFFEIRPPQRLVFTWCSTVTRGEETLVTVELRSQGAATELSLTHERLPDEHAATQHESGWQSITAKLVAHLRGDV
jgi:uncharacterized protein YndB with AHSA1/START domain